MVNTLDLVFFSTQLVLLIIFSVQIKINGRAARYLVIGMILGVIATTFSLLNTVLPNTPGRAMLALQLIFYGAEYIAVYMHFYGTISDKIDFTQVSLISIVYGIHTAFGIHYALYGNEDLSEFIWDISYNLLGVICFIYVCYSLILAYRYTREFSAILQVIAAILLWMGFFIGLFTTPLVRDAIGVPFNTEITDIIKAIGILLIIIVYIVNPDYIERLPVQTYGIMAFDKGGSTLSYHQISSRGQFKDISSESQAFLMTSLTRAILSFVKEALGSNTDLDRIEAADKLIMFEIGDDIGVAVIAERGTRILQQSVFRCQEQLDSLIGSDIKQGEINTTKIREVISESFPYIVFVN